MIIDIVDAVVGDSKEPVKRRRVEELLNVHKRGICEERPPVIVKEAHALSLRALQLCAEGESPDDCEKAKRDHECL